MSNKMLVGVIVAIVLVLAGVVAAFHWHGNKSNNNTFSYNNTEPSSPTSTPTRQETQPPVSTSTPAAIPSSTPPTIIKPTSMNCTRNFDEKTLNTAKVNIHDRTVEIDVTGYGKIQLAFYDTDAPKAVENFLRLTNAGFYNCLTFHRIAKGFVIQGGDPKGDGTGGQSAFGQPFADELNADTASYKAGYQKGVLAMANSGPNTNGSQFFIMLDTVPLNHAYTIFGKVTSGLDVVDKIGQADINVNPMMGGNDGAPVKPIVMESVKIVK